MNYVADAMLEDAKLAVVPCEQCGNFHSTALACRGVSRRPKRRNPCPLCQKWVVGLRDHMWDRHAQPKGGNR